MRRLLALAITLALIATSCGGGSTESTQPSANPVDTTSEQGDPETAVDTAGETADDGDPDGGETESVGGGDATGEAGGGVDQGLVAELDLPTCPVGAHLDVDGPVEIDFWHPYTTLTEEAMQDLAAGFNASQDKIIVNVEAQGSYGELLAKYRESISFDDLPAIAITDAGSFRDMVDSGTVLPAQSCIEAEGVDLDAIDEVIRGFYSIDGALYPAAMNVSTPVLYYNRDHFEAAGLDPDVPPTTLAELQDAAQAIQDAGVAETPLSLILHGWFVDTWLNGAGVPLVNADNGRAGNATEATFNGPEALELYTLLQEMNDAGLIVAFSNTPGQVSHYLAATGPASMIIETSTASTTIAGVLGGTANLSELVEGSGLDGEIIGNADLTINIGVAPMPGLRSPGKVFISGGGYYISNTVSDAEQAAAWEFLKYVGEPAQQKILHLKGSYLPINAAVLADPEVRSVWETDAAGQWLAIAYDQLTTIDPQFPGPAIGPFSEQREIFNRSLEELLLEGRDPVDVLADAEDALNDALSDYADADF